MTLKNANGEAMRFASTADLDLLRPDLERLVAQAVEAVRACSAKPDPTFGSWAELVAAIRSTAFHEGMLLERGVARVALCNPDLIVVPQDRPMPIVPAAKEFLRRNEVPLRGIRLSPEVHARESYAPDLVIVDTVRHAALILDVKRSLSSYETRRLNDLRSRMMAAAMIAGDWLSLECRTPPVGDVSVAIIDGSDETVDHDRGVWGLSEIGELLEVNGAGEAMAILRTLFGREVRAILAERCRTVMMRELGVGRSHDGRNAMRSCSDRHGAVGRPPDEPERGRQTVSRVASAGRTLMDTDRCCPVVQGTAMDDAVFADLLARLDPDFRTDHAGDDGDEDHDDAGTGTNGTLLVERARIQAAARIGFARSRVIQ